MSISVDLISRRGRWDELYEVSIQIWCALNYISQEEVVFECGTGGETTLNILTEVSD